MSGGIIYHYEDGGSYCGEREGAMSHGHGVCTGPKGQGTFEGKWDHGNQVSGVYRWPNGMKYCGTWQDNLRHGKGTETRVDGTEYSGEFSRGARGPLGIAILPNSKYSGQWLNGAQDGEGVETYRDHGCYRGQYKNGHRSGYGTRTTGAYEASYCAGDFSFTASISEPFLSHTSLNNESANTKTPAHLIGKEYSQMYSGEWKSDKRHGYGTLRIKSHSTYYGQWISNARSGYGVVVYENGTKEEGEWHNGQLMVVLKRQKVLSFKSNKLESKVREAHTKAIQASKAAEAKADLAESRADSASTASSRAYETVKDVEELAQIARDRASLYKHATQVEEHHTKTPMTNIELSFPEVDSTSQVSRMTSVASTTSSSDSPRMNRLEINTSIMPSSSFEDIHKMYGSGLKNSESDLNITTFNDSQSSLGLGADAASIQLRMKPEHLQLGHSNSSFTEKSVGKLPSRRKRSTLPQLIHPSSTKDFQDYGTSFSDPEEDEAVVERLHIRLRKRDKTTGTVSGEVDHGDLTDDELRGDDDRLSRFSKEGRVKTHFVSGSSKEEKNIHTDTIDILNQMAKWNKMVAYINFALLLFLLSLILIVFSSMYYYQLVSYYKNHPDPEDHQSPSNFLTPLA